MLVYPAGLDVSTTHLTFLARQLRAHRRRIASPWRRLTPGRQALLVLAYLRKNETYSALAAGFAVGVATVCRYVHEALDVLAALAPSLDQALVVIARKAYTVLDGTLIETDRVRTRPRGADRRFFSGKVHRHAMNVQVIADGRGDLLYTSDALPGASHDITCARTGGLLEALAACPTLVLADKGYHGAPAGICTPFVASRRDPGTGLFTRRELSHNEKAVNAAHAKLRAHAERANAQLKSWRVLRRVRMSPEQTTDLVHSVTALIHADH